MKLQIMFLLLCAFCSLAAQQRVGSLMILINKNATSGDAIDAEAKTALTAKICPLLLNASLARLLLIAQSEQSLDDWDIYLCKKASFTLFIPQGYYTLAQAMCPDCSPAQALGLAIDDQNIFQKFEHDAVSMRNLRDALAAHANPDARLITPAFPELFKPFDKKAPLSWNVYIAGHGSPATRPLSQIGLKPTSGERQDIAGMPSDEFVSLLLMLNNLPAHIIIWRTCYGGGKNAQAVAQLLEINDRVSNPIHVKKTDPSYKPRNFIAVSLAATDLMCHAIQDPDFANFFNALKELFSKQPPSVTPDDIAKAVRNISAQTPIILMPPSAKTPNPQWQLAASDIFLDTAIVINDDTQGPLTIETARQILLYKKNIDFTIKILQTPDGYAQFRGRMPDNNEYTIKAIETNIDPLIFVVQSFLDANVNFSKPTELSAQSAFNHVTFFTIKELVAFNPAQKIKDILDSKDFSLYIENVKVIAFPKNLIHHGWLMFTHTDDSGTSHRYLFQALQNDLILRDKIPVTGDAKKLARLEKEKRNQILANELLQEMAVNGEIDLVDSFVHMMKKVKSGFKKLTSDSDVYTKNSPEEEVFNRLRQRGLPAIAPDQQGIDDAYIDAAAVQSVALGVLAPWATQQAKEIATDMFMRINPSNRNFARLLAMLAAHDQRGIDDAFRHSERTFEASYDKTANILAYIVSPYVLTEDLFTSNKQAPSFFMLNRLLEAHKGDEPRFIHAAILTGSDHMAESLLTHPAVDTPMAQDLFSRMTHISYSNINTIFKLITSGKLDEKTIEDGLVNLLTIYNPDDLPKIINASQITIPLLKQALAQLGQHPSDKDETQRIATINKKITQLIRRLKKVEVPAQKTEAPATPQAQEQSMPVANTPKKLSTQEP